MAEYLKHVIFIFYFLHFVWSDLSNAIDPYVVKTSSYAFWPNATIPFYINPDHFDHEQSMSIMTTLSYFAFKTCLKFAPVMVKPEDSQHVMVFENPDGVRKCSLSTSGHSIDEPHKITLGYDCLRSPHIDMLLMKSLGFPFEHNRPSRDLYIEVQIENIQPGEVDLFNKDLKLPLELRSLPYDVNSVMHFGERDYSKNGHRTIIFKDHKTVQRRVGLTPTDLRKIEIVYGPECRRRDRQEKMELCQSYPGVARKKREVVSPDNVNLRVNRDITPPPKELNDNITQTLKDLGIQDKVQEIIEQIHKVSSQALSNARIKYCNDSKPLLRASDPHSDIMGIVELIAEYAHTMIQTAAANLTVFCEQAGSIEQYQRYQCQNVDLSGQCRYKSYRSTKSGPVVYSTKHYPLIFQSTRHHGASTARHFDMWLRNNNNTDETTQEPGTEERSRKKRDAQTIKTDEVNVTTVMDKVVTVPPKTEGNTTNATTEGINTTTTSLTTETTVSVEANVNVINESIQAVANTTISALRRAPSILRADKRYDRRQIFQGRRYRAKNTKGKKKEAWDESNMSLEEAQTEKNLNYDVFEAKKKPEKKEKRDKYDKKKGSGMMRMKKKIPKTVTLSKENEEFYAERRWPDGLVRYIIDDGDTQYDIADVRRRLEEVNAILKKKTCVRLEEITKEDAERYEDYLVLDRSADYVTGRVGGKQIFGNIELFHGGQHRQHAAMVVMAMIGFYFEVSRHDRDKYIRVHMRHVRPDKLHHFEKIREDATLPLPYDYKSATHPAWQFWRKIGKTGISTVATYKEQDPDGSIMKSLGQNEQLLSDIDIIKINSVYGIKCFQSVRKFKPKERKAKKRY